ncbi:MAG TPA: glycosyltransferase family 39 protein, partial [Acidimicrobiales bacterium]
GDQQARSSATGGRRATITVAVGIVLVAAVVARFLAVSPLWLDEALTVNIARLPVVDMLQARRHDGAPPLYYLLLHGWMDMAGTGDVAVRALSGLLAVGSLPLMWLAGRRLVAEADDDVDPDRGRRVAWAGVLLLAASPFAIRYATEARMYSLVVVLVLAGFLALDTVLHRRSVAASVVLGAVTGLLLLTHYWAFYLLAAVAALLASQWRRAEGARRALLAMAGGSLLFVPWLPSFLDQMGATGTPWGQPPKPRAVFDIVIQFGAGLTDTALPLGLLLYALVALGLFGAAAGPGRVAVDLHGRPPGRKVAAAAGLTMVLAVVIGQITGSAFAIRYAAVVLPLVLLVAALGASTLVGRPGPVVVGLAVVLGFVTAIPHMAGDRTSAGRVAAALRAEARPGDVVAYCPDQLGPSVSRVLAAGPAPELVQVTFPRGTGPELVDWVDYEATNRAAATGPFARLLLDRAGPDHSVWVVWAPAYRTFGTKCQSLLADLRQARPDERRVVTVTTRTLERPGLVQYPGGGQAPLPTSPP